MLLLIIINLLKRLTLQDYVPDQLSELAEALANPIKYQSELDKREHQLAVLTDDTEEPAERPDDALRRPTSTVRTKTSTAVRTETSFSGMHYYN